MTNSHPNLYIIAGPNGAGKTTFAKEFLPHFAKCEKFVNADEIARGISPLAPRAGTIEAGRFVLKKIRELSSKRQSFGFETTLSGRSYIVLLRKLRESGYKIHLVYLWLPTVELAIQRVHERVRRGGHSVPEEDIRRRFNRGLKNLFHEYRNLFDTWAIWDNSGTKPIMAAYQREGNINMLNEDFVKQIMKGKEKL